MNANICAFDLACKYFTTTGLASDDFANGFDHQELLYDDSYDNEHM